MGSTSLTRESTYESRLDPERIFIALGVGAPVPLHPSRVRFETTRALRPSRFEPATRLNNPGPDRTPRRGRSSSKPPAAFVPVSFVANCSEMPSSEKSNFCMNPP